MDKYLVTVGRFREFVTAWNGGMGYTPPASSGKHTHLNGGNGLASTAGGYEPGWLVSDNGNIIPTNGNLACDATYATWTNDAGANETRPINCVSWWEAYAFCIWDGGFLPSEAEWEYAAAAGGQEREYPWGAAGPGVASQYAIYDCDYPRGPGTCASKASIAPVGTATLGASLWGQLDLAGDLWEWNLDWYAPYAPCTDCVDVSASTVRMIRGGYFGSLASDLLPPFRGAITATKRNLNLGFRCSRTP
jgi:formylglycine-generating enzyme required for sulfatase activity